MKDLGIGKISSILKGDNVKGNEMVCSLNRPNTGIYTSYGMERNV